MEVSLQMVMEPTTSLGETNGDSPGVMGRRMPFGRELIGNDEEVVTAVPTWNSAV